MGYRRLRIVTPGLGAYYGVVDEDYRPHEFASRWLAVRFFGRAQPETTSAQYSSSVALFLTWSQQTGRDLIAAARDLHLFAAYLATTVLTVGVNVGPRPGLSQRAVDPIAVQGEDIGGLYLPRIQVRRVEKIGDEFLAASHERVGEVDLSRHIPGPIGWPQTVG